MEWLKNEKLAIENKKKESPFLSRRERFRNEFLRRVVPWEKITVSWDSFPYYLHDHTKKLLVECAASHLKHKKFTTDYGGRLTSSSGRILLQSMPGTELYRERLVRALARDLQVPLMVLDGNILAPYDFNEDESESDEENAETSESEAEDENDASNEEDYTSGGEARTDGSDDEVDIHASAEALRKLIPYNIEEFEKSVSGESETSSTSSTSESAEPSDKANRPLKKGDRVKYIGPSICIEANNRIVLGKIPTPDGPTNAYTVIRGRLVAALGNLSLSHFSILDLVFLLSFAGGSLNIFIFLSIELYCFFSICCAFAGIFWIFPWSTREVYEVNGEQIAVIFDIGGKTTEEVKDEKTAENAAKPSVCWLHGPVCHLQFAVKDIEHDLDAQTHDCYVAMEVLCIEVSTTTYRLFSRFFTVVIKGCFKVKSERVCSQSARDVRPIVRTCSVDLWTKQSGNRIKRKGEISSSFEETYRGIKSQQTIWEDEIYKLFTNVMSIYPQRSVMMCTILISQRIHEKNFNVLHCSFDSSPLDDFCYLPPVTISKALEEDLLRIFNKQIEEDRRIVISRSNLTEIHKTVNNVVYVFGSDGVEAEKVVGWAKSHHLSSCLLPSVKGDRLQLPRESLELAILRLKEQEAALKKPSQNLKNLAKDEYESNFVSAVVPPGEIGVKFDDVGALEDVKKALNELVILPMRRPELFSRGNLLRPCKGILLFGPPGTGKTLLAKALATEAGASFISITGSTLTSKWFGDAEKLTRALFSFASKLAPVIIFVDEVDSLLGARGGAFEHEATRRMRNEFMAAWDGLRSKDSQRILILGATNRPFDLDDAVIRRLPRRIYVDLPDAENRLKILKIMLARENLESGFPFEQLANATEGYSGSDLKNLCIAAAYRPVQELLEKESKGDKHDGLPVLRPLKLEDFTHSKAKVGPSVAYDAASMNELRKWNDQYGEGGSRRKSPFGF
ncbi:Spastin [Sesamum angolense]|uniref:Spastin n=1 Tax=Sesamum angolense TaxID=2727404 RepID=A0AAE1WK70_9LAMI|nr:Spastin [Sesamum angolense]